MRWFVDFDDTLVLGPTTWGVQTVIPAMVKEYSLFYDADTLAKALLEGQEREAAGTNDLEALETIFRVMGWPTDLMGKFMNDVFKNYVPSVFEDTLPFLKRLAELGQPVYIVSNNNHAAQLAEHLGIAPHIADIFTPKGCGLERGKPNRAFWDYITARCDTQNAVLVGDDPWYDGAFATNCGLPCYIVDRMKRFAHLRDKYHVVGSLGDIPTG